MVREVKEEYAVISLPTMLAGFVRREEVSLDEFVVWSNHVLDLVYDIVG